MPPFLLASFAVALLVSAVDARADFSFNDCVLNGLKGVSSDAAARMIRSACDAKLQEFRRERLNELEQQYGVTVSLDTVQVAEQFDSAEDGYWAIKITNLDGQRDRVIAYILIGISPAPGPGLPCIISREVEIAYKVAIRTGASARLMFRPPGSESACVAAKAVRTRVSSWRDFSFSESYRPLDRNPFKEP
jgi:hypothetical protein